MTIQPLPAELHVLFPAGKAAQRRLATALPSGRIVMSDEGRGDIAALWCSDTPATADLFRRLYAERGSSGLQPLLLDALDPGDQDYRPWGSGELFFGRLSTPERHDPAALLAAWWRAHTSTEDDEDDLAVTAPFGRRWPGLVPAIPQRGHPDDLALDYAEALLARHTRLRLGLVAAPSGSHALTRAGWGGPLNYDNDTAKFSAVLASWEQRFGARVVAVGFDTLHLSVAAPPADQAAARHLAAEHFAFCPDNVWQGSGSLTAYAEHLVDAHAWQFWWD